jgi:ABC-type uncharacterized transport system auxiliary subunit
MIKYGFIVLILSAVMIAGCFSRPKPAYMIDQYAIEYPAPALAGLATLDESIKIERFSVSQAFNSQAMVYRTQPFRLASYNYSRWRVSPGDMVTDYLLRDLRSLKILRTVYSYHDPERSRFVIEGGVGEFLESTDESGTRAILSLNVTLLDMHEKEVFKSPLFQRQYRFQEPAKEHSPEGFARAMSVNMPRFSEQLAKDIHEAIASRVGRRD